MGSFYLTVLPFLAHGFHPTVQEGYLSYNHYICIPATRTHNEGHSPFHLETLSRSYTEHFHLLPTGLNLVYEHTQLQESLGDVGFISGARYPAKKQSSVTRAKGKIDIGEQLPDLAITPQRICSIKEGKHSMQKVEENQIKETYIV